MARPLRIEYPGAFYHVYSRGLERREIFRDKKDYESFLRIFTEIQKKTSFICHAYCLMPNHYHLYLETPQGNLSRIMQEVNGRYTQFYNRRRKRVGPLFQGRYKAKLIDQEAYSLQLARYIHLNPVKAKIAPTAEAWKWSSYGAFMESGRRAAFLETEWLLKQIGTRKEFARFTMNGLKETWDPLEPGGRGPVLGTESFIERIKKKFVPDKKDSSLTGLREIKKDERVKDVEAAVKRLKCPEGLKKKLLLYGLRRYTAISLKEAGEKAGGMRAAAVSQCVRRFDEDACKSKGVKHFLEQLICQL